MDDELYRVGRMLTDYQGAVSLDGQALQVFYPNGPIYAGQPQHAQGLGLAVETVIA